MREACYPGKIALVALAAALSVGLTPTAASAQEQLRMEDAIRLALMNNERALKAPLRVETAEGQVDRARTAFFPSLVFGYFRDRYDSIWPGAALHIFYNAGWLLLAGV